MSLGELLSAVRLALEKAFPLPVWVAADVADIRVNGSSGHCYLELVEKGEGAVPSASTRAVAWRAQWGKMSDIFRAQTGSAIEAGMRILVKATVGYHELYGFSLTISDIDPAYTLGERERQRQLTIAQLHSDGVWDMNRSVGFPAVVQRVAVISASGAAGYRDFLQELDRFPYLFRVEHFEAVMQGLATEESIVGALERIAERTDEFDAVVILRGGGSTSDLSAFDGYRLASHVAQFPLPVVTGIGHDKDRSVVDMVAAMELKTPTAVAVWLAEGLSEVWDFLEGLYFRVSTFSENFLGAEKLRLERIGRVVSLGAVEMTRRMELRLGRLGGEVARLSSERLLRENNLLTGFGAFFAERPTMMLALLAERLASYGEIVEARRPENILSLGFAVVRADGRAVRDAAELSEGQVMDITLAKGSVKAKTI